MGGRKSPFPITLAIGLYNSLYGTSRDTHTFEKADVLSERAYTADEGQHEDDDTKHDGDDRQVEDGVEHVRVFRLQRVDVSAVDQTILLRERPKPDTDQS